MLLHHAIIVCHRDEHLIPEHVRHVDALLDGRGIARSRCCYFAESEDWIPDTGGVPFHIVQFLEMYENLPLKTYGMMQHALTIPGWTHLLKADVNSHPTAFDTDAIENNHLVGYYTDTTGYCANHAGRVEQLGLAEPFMGPMPTVWCGGPAYVVSRLLATKIVSLGAWAARAWPYEDQMVSHIAAENGWPAVPGIGYWTDGKDWRQDGV